MKPFPSLRGVIFYQPENGIDRHAFAVSGMLLLPLLTQEVGCWFVECLLKVHWPGSKQVSWQPRGTLHYSWLTIFD